MKNILNKYKINILIIAIIAILSAAFVPNNFKDKSPVGGDMSEFKGAASEIIKYTNSGEQILWTNTIFSGMPSYVISSPRSEMILKYLQKPTLPRVWAQLFLYLICSFIMLLSFGVRPWLALIGAVGIGFATENLTILHVGHTSKAAAIGYLPLVIAGIQYLFRKKQLLGLTILSAGLGLEIFVNHVQITYYGGFMVALYFIFQLVKHIKDKKIKDYGIAAGFSLLGLVIALGANSLNLMLMQEYAEDSNRGKSTLSISKNASDNSDPADGLTKDYVFSYSMGWSDYGAMFIPNYSGGDTDKTGLYYGQIGSTSGPKYLGATLFILMLLGLVLVRGPHKWWLISVMILTVILSMGGNHFVGINTLMYEYFPLYNKFRAPSNIMVLLQISVGLLAILGLEELFKNQANLTTLKKPLIIAGSTGAALIILLTFTGTMFNDFNSTPKENELGQIVYDADTEYAKNVIKNQKAEPNQTNINRFKEQLSDLRIEAMKKDGQRSLFFALIILALVWLVYSKKIETKYIVLLVGIFVLADLWFIGKRQLDHKKFKKTRVADAPFVAYTADLEIKKDKSYYRVLDLTRSPINSNRCSYFHKSIGGYSAAKIRRFQDLWEWYLTDDLQNARVQNNAILNMLNMKYFIYPNQQQQGAQPMYGMNQNALGNAWIVPTMRVVENPDSAILALGKLNSKNEGFVEKEFANLISRGTAVDSNATISLSSYHPEKLTYTYNSAVESNVAFSEVFYDKGWEATIDSEPVDHFRMNYVLRGLKVPAGKHDIVFEFKPQTYKTGKILSTTFGGIIYLLIAASLFFWIKGQFLTNTKEA